MTLREVAPLRRRLAAWCLDAVIAGAVLALPTIGLQQVLGGPPELGDRVSYTEFLEETAPTLISLAVLELVLFVVLVAFDGGRTGATPGKRLMGVRVVHQETFGPLGYGRATVRRLVYLLGGALLYAGWWWVLVDGRRQAWHDKAARSLVVRTR